MLLKPAISSGRKLCQHSRRFTGKAQVSSCHRTIADRSAPLTAGLEGAPDISVAHLAEALQHRQRGLG